MLIRVKPYETKRTEAAKNGDDRLVWATHPDVPNFSGNARGRKIHLERDDDKFNYPATYCAMRVTEYSANLTRALCIQCVQIRDQEKMNQEFKRVVG